MKKTLTAVLLTTGLILGGRAKRFRRHHRDQPY